MSVLCQCEICLALMLVYPYVMYVGYQPYTGTICTACPQFWSWSHQFRYLPTGSLHSLGVLGFPFFPWRCAGVYACAVRSTGSVCLVFLSVPPGDTADLRNRVDVVWVVGRYLHILCVVFSAISPAAVSVLHLGPLS